MQIKKYNHKDVTLRVHYDRRRMIHYIRYSLPSVKLDNKKYKQRRFRKDESLKFIFKEGFNYTHNLGKKGEAMFKLNPLQKSQNKKYIKRLNEILGERQTDITRGEYEIPSKSITHCFFDYLERHRNNPVKQYSYQTKCGYNSLEKHLKEFHQLNTLPFELFDMNWVQKFHGYLVSEAPNMKHISGGRLSGITILKRIKDFKYIVGRAVIDKVIPYHPFGQYEIYEKGKTPKSRFGDWLEPSELKLLAENPLPYKSTYDMFMFMSTACMAYAEAYNLTWGQISDYEKHSSIKYTRKKTDVPRTLEISLQAREYLGERGISDVRVFDITANVDDINKRLQMWAKMCGINKHLTTHAGKRTFAYCFYLKTKDIFALQQILGHNDLKSTQRYVAAFQIDTKTAIQQLTVSGGLF